MSDTEEKSYAWFSHKSADENGFTVHYHEDGRLVWVTLVTSTPENPCKPGHRYHRDNRYVGVVTKLYRKRDWPLGS